jgi:hypothetical protein
MTGKEEEVERECWCGKADDQRRRRSDRGWIPIALDLCPPELRRRSQDSGKLASTRHDRQSAGLLTARGRQKGDAGGMRPLTTEIRTDLFAAVAAKDQRSPNAATTDGLCSVWGDDGDNANDVPAGSKCSRSMYIQKEERSV